MTTTLTGDAAPHAALLTGMADLARRLRPGGRETSVVLSHHGERLIVRHGDVVLKAHPPGSGPQPPAARLRLVATSCCPRCRPRYPSRPRYPTPPLPVWTGLPSGSTTDG